MIRENLRNYEVSVWTLQDDFITVLRAPKLEHKGQIDSPVLTISDDGTEKFTFSIPMYLFKDNERYENPIWYTTRNGMIMQNLRKIKVIIDKAAQYEKVYEFLINNVSEQHSEKTLMCKVECDGLAFNELGKVGFKVSMSGDAFYNEDYEWFIKARDSKGNLKVRQQPVATLQYWVNKCLKPAPESDAEWANQTISSAREPGQWYYRVDMDYTAYSLASGDRTRDRHKVYEDEYITGWDDEGEVPTYDVCAEKERIIDVEESNLYNITQEIAKKFSVFCRYVYSYDANYHIIGRTVIFYNSFIKESEGFLDLTYPYSTTDITRTIDSNDLTTKLLVRAVESDFGDSGLATITTVPANYSMEDYILNFDYLHNIKTISEEQYAAVSDFNKAMHTYNTKLINYEDQIITYENKLIDLKAKYQVAVNAQAKDQEEITNSKALLNALTDNTGIIHITEDAPKSAVLLQGDSVNIDGISVSTYYVKMPDDGILYETLHIYKKYTGTKTSGRVENEVIGTPVYDDYNGLVRVENIHTTFAALESKVVYLVYDYHPKLYYEAVQRKWEIRLANDTADMIAYKAEIDSIETKLNTTWETAGDGGLNGLYEELLAAKEQAIQEFQNLMGAALREGYWQPEEYADYGAKECGSIRFNGSAATQVSSTAPHASLIWDEDLFAEEQDISYKISVTESTEYYPCVKLNAAQLAVIKNHPDQVGIVFYPTLYDAHLPDALKLPRCFVLGSQCEVRFVKQNDTIFPVLLVTGADEFTEDELIALKQTGTLQAKIGYLTVTYASGDTYLTLSVSSDAVTIDSNQWLTLNSAYKCVYPRIKVNTLKMKNAVDQLGLQYTDFNPLTTNSVSSSDMQKVFEYAQDYYVLTRGNYYLLTPKPQEIIKTGILNGYLSFYYALSTADEAIYIDAQQISKENAEPKVSYSINVGFVWPEILEQLHLSLDRLVHVNDIDLKLNNVRGYISEIELYLDEIWNDKVTVQDYKSKFEDLFSSIVAQTAQMSKNAYANSLISQAFTAEGALSQSTLDSTNLIGIVSNLYETYQFETMERVQEQLTRIFNEAGRVLEDVNGSLNGIYALTETGANILSQYASNVAAALTPTQFISTSKPTNWKPGDIWYNPTDGSRYVATAYPEYSDESSLTNAGWNQTYDGSLAQIRSTLLNVDAAAGLVDVQATGVIRARAQSYMYLASDDIQITGNSRVNIGSSKWINIAAQQGISLLASGVFTTDATTGAINNVTYDSNGKVTQINGTNVQSAITLTNGGIFMAASAKIEMKSGQGIDIWSSGNSAASVIRVNPTEGIYMGTTNGITLFTGALGASGSKAAVQLTKDKILFGASNTAANTTAFEMTPTYIIAGAGNVMETLRSGNPSTSTAGVKITKDSIYLAAASGGTINLISMTSNGIRLGTVPSSGTSGSYVAIAQTGIVIGSTAKLYINTTNMGLDSTESTNTVFRLGPASAPQLSLVNGVLTVKGAIKATSLYINATSSSDGVSINTSNGFVVTNTTTVDADKIKTIAGIKVDGNGVVISSSTSDVASALQKSASIKVDNNGVVISSSTTNSQTAVRATAGIKVDSSGVVLSSSSTASTAVRTAAGIKVDSSGVVLSSTATASSAVRSAANISVDATTGIVVQASGGNYADRIAKLSVKDDAIDIACTNVGKSTSGIYITSNSIAISTAGAFTVESNKFNLDNSGNVRIDGVLSNNGQPVLTSGNIIYSSSEPTSSAQCVVGNLWLKPYSSGGGGGSTPTGGTYTGTANWGINPGFHTRPSTIVCYGQSLGSGTYSVGFSARLFFRDKDYAGRTYTVYCNFGGITCSATVTGVTYGPHTAYFSGSGSAVLGSSVSATFTCSIDAWGMYDGTTISVSVST